MMLQMSGHMLLEEYAAVKPEVTSRLAAVPFVAITVDGWSQKQGAEHCLTWCVVGSQETFMLDCVHPCIVQTCGPSDLLMRLVLPAGMRSYGRTTATLSTAMDSTGRRWAWAASCRQVAVIDQWYEELCIYSYANPRWAPNTGHFTQLVWRSTARVGCAVGNCPMGSTDAQGNRWGGPVVVCEWDATGNWMGQFRSNVPPLQPGATNICSSR
ncbi:hypothetical protein QJQ45_025532 [Haematococcus lacustris]|nr:hypothetical protein QJQ45_025532 [Haematococcus lacustris]